MKVQLTVFERLILQNLLPKEGNFVTLRLMRVLKEALSFDELENKKLEFKQEGDRLTWNQEAADGIVKEVEIGETMENLIVKTLKDMDEKSKLTPDHVTLYEKFIANRTPDLRVVPGKEEEPSVD